MATLLRRDIVPHERAGAILRDTTITKDDLLPTMCILFGEMDAGGDGKVEKLVDFLEKSYGDIVVRKGELGGVRIMHYVKEIADAVSDLSSLTVFVLYTRNTVNVSATMWKGINIVTVYHNTREEFEDSFEKKEDLPLGFLSEKPFLEMGRPEQAIEKMVEIFKANNNI